jgi:multiple sugar transport system permease protein
MIEGDKMNNKNTASKVIKKYLSNIVLTVIGILFLIPLLWLIIASFDPGANLSFRWPSQLSLQNYASVLKNSASVAGYINSAVITCIQTVIVVICSIMGAYPLSRYHMKNSRRITMGVLFMTALPVAALMVPVYQLFILMHLVDSTAGTILFISATSLPMGIWMMKNFLDGVPVEIEEAAWVDGASVVTTLTRVIMPLMLPGIFTVAITAFINCWGNFFIPFILLSSQSKLPAAVVIYQFFGEHGMIAYGALAAYSMMYMLPAFILYFIAQKYMSQGFIMGGAAKG